MVFVMIFFTGFVVAMGLIVAIGAQNAWVLSMSVRRIYPWSVAIVCFSIDAFLMAIGVLSFAQIQRWLPSIVPWLTLVGIVMLLWLALQAVRRAAHGNPGLQMESKNEHFTQRSAVMTALAISLLNPHVYLDTVVLIGNIASSSANPYLFWLGSASASIVWFSSLAAIGPVLRKWLSSTQRWRLFDSAMAIVMTWVAISLYSSL